MCANKNALAAAETAPTHADPGAPRTIAMLLQPLSTLCAPGAVQRRRPWRRASVGCNASPFVRSLRTHCSAQEPSPEPDADAAVATPVDLAGSSSAHHPPNTCVAVVKFRNSLKSLAIGPGGRFVAGATAVREEIIIWDTHPFGLTTRRLKSFDLQGYEYCMAISEDGQWLVAASDKGWVVLVDMRKAQQQPLDPAHRDKESLTVKWTHEAGDAITAVAITPDGRYTVAGSEWGQLLLWDMQRSEPECYNVQLPDRSTILAASISPDGQQVTAISSSDGVWTWEWELQTLHKEPVTLPRSSEFSHLHISSDGERATGVYNFELVTCRIGGKLKRLMRTTVSSVTSCSVTPDGRFAATGHDDNRVRVWDVERGTRIASLRGHTDTVRAVAISPDAKHVVSGSYEEAGLRVWQL